MRRQCPDPRAKYARYLPLPISSIWVGLPRPGRINCGFQVQGFAQRRRHREDLGIVSELENSIDAIGGGPIVGDLVLVPSKEEGRALVTAGRLHLDQLFAAALVEGADVVAGAVAIVTGDLSDVVGVSRRRHLSKSRTNSSPWRPSSRLRSLRAAGSNFLTSRRSRAARSASQHPQSRC